MATNNATSGTPTHQAETTVKHAHLPVNNMQQSQDAKISMRKWTRMAVRSVDLSSLANNSFAAFGSDPSNWPVDVKQSLAVSSESFLASAILVAVSLADQICQVEEAAAPTQPTSANNNWLPNCLPAPSSDWASHVAVLLNSTPSRSISNEDKPSESNFDEFDLQPLPFSANGDSNHDELDDMQALLNSIVQTEEEKNSNPQLDEGSYLDVKGAKILLPSANRNICSNSEKMERIYSLGLVFYELFSGGKIPPELVSSKSSSADTKELFDLDPLPPDELLNHLPTNSVNIEDALHILDDLGSDDALFGGSEGKHGNSGDQHHSKKSRDSKPTAKIKGSRMCPVSIEPLKLLRLPNALCDLISNMLDCANGDLRGDKSYSEVEDIRSDLRLMMDKPDIFLRDLDLEALSRTGLEMSNFTFERETELSTLFNAYQCSISGESELAIICGPSGVGKSVMANQLAQMVTANGGIFLSGKFDQLRQAKPFSSLAEAFDEYCNILLRDKESSRSSLVASKLRTALGREATYLTNIIPKLKLILGEECLAHNFSDQDCANGQKRIQYLLCQFVEVISSSSEAPVLLFLDDLQWADPSSIDVIRQLLLVSGSSTESKQFFFLGCCRDNEINSNHPVWKMVSTLRHFGVNSTLTSLRCMDKEFLNKTVSELLGLFPRLTRTLSEIVYHKTKGNPLFFSQLMLSLAKEGLLQLSLSRRRWIWNEEKIQERELPDDVAAFFITTIKQLPKEVQTALSVLSCFGGSTECSVLEIIEKECQVSLIRPLEKAVLEGLLDKKSSKFKFSHDRVQEAANNMMKSEERCLYHSQYGMALCAEALKSKNDNMLFTAVDQLNRGGPAAISEKEQALTLAQMNLMAGKKALQMSDYRSAFSYFDHGISFLRKNHWKEHYELSLDLFECASVTSFATGDLTSLSILSDQILRNVRSFEDKLNTLYLATIALAYSLKLQESVEKGLAVLSQLGEEFPDDCSTSDIEKHTNVTKQMLEGVSNETLLNHKQMTDHSKIMAMKFLAKMNPTLLMIRPFFQPLVTLKMVQLSLVFGMSPMSAQAFSYFGSLLGSLGEIREGYRFVKIAKDLNDRFGSNEFAGDLMCASTELKCYVEPVQTTIEFYVEGRNIAMAAGDIGNAMFNTLQQCAGNFWAGTNLMLTKELCVKAQRLMEQLNHLTWQVQLGPVVRSVSTLLGLAEPETRCGLSVEDPGQRETPLELKLLQQNPYLSMTFYCHKMILSYIFRNFDAMKDFAQKYLSKTFSSWVLAFGHSMRVFFTGLVSFWVSRKSKNDPKWLQRGQSAITSMRLWFNNSSWTFENKLLTLEAEEQYCRGDVDGAKSSYDKAIASARQHKFIHEEALACELAGYLYLDLDEKSTAVEYFTKAQERYHEWGAFAKVRQLHVLVKDENSSLPRDADVPALNVTLKIEVQENRSSDRKRAL